MSFVINSNHIRGPAEQRAGVFRQVARECDCPELMSRTVVFYASAFESPAITFQSDRTQSFSGIF